MDITRPTTNGAGYTLWQMVLYMLRLGSLGFGGPVALVGYMQRDLVEQRKWITEADYKEGLALAQLAPGPLAAQLGIYIGYVHYRLLGATLAGMAFVLPSFLIVLALGWAYVRFGGLAWMESAREGVATSAGTVMLSALPMLMGSQLVLAFLAYDIASVPRHPKHQRFQVKGKVEIGRDNDKPE